MNTETKRKLNAMAMNDFISAIEAQEANAALYIPMPFDERISAVVDDVFQHRYNEKILRRIKAAKLRYPNASLTEVDYTARGLDKGLINELASMHFLNCETNIIIQGFTGSGKTYLACAIAKEACKKDIKTYTIRLPEMLQKRAEEKILNREKNYLNKLASYSLLVIDEWLIFDITEDDLRFIYELIDRRYATASTIFVSQYDFEKWHERLGGGTHADSILDRIIHNKILIKSGQANMREIYDAKKLNSK